VQDGTGAVARVIPPPGAKLPHGWTVEALPAPSAHAPGGPNHRAEAPLLHFLHAAAGLRSTAAPADLSAPPRAARVPRAGDPALWGLVIDGRSGARVWEHFVSGETLLPGAAPPAGARLRGGEWLVVAADAPPADAPGAPTLLFHPRRQIVKGWDEALPPEAFADWAAAAAPEAPAAGASPAPDPAPPHHPLAVSPAPAHTSEGPPVQVSEALPAALAYLAQPPPPAPLWHRFRPEGAKVHVWRCGNATVEHDGDLPIGAETADGWTLAGDGDGQRWWAHRSGEVAWRGPWVAAEAEARAQRREEKRAARDEAERRRERRRRRRAEREGGGATTGESSAAEAGGAEDAGEDGQ
jgi:hypothetical protein